ncbi:hypothetical protein HPB51_010656 [Rhipicephalus microplus]|uniref:Uncharacterized protein n=1 Tax=Rhipicephalus microplus TaxID=6941 RepID=A0A9J6DLS2_RHIMP|nr:hypothetical protein HPB51_010656 [Rhipicephalus microplus]
MQASIRAALLLVLVPDLDAVSACAVLSHPPYLCAGDARAAYLWELPGSNISTVFAQLHPHPLVINLPWLAPSPTTTFTVSPIKQPHRSAPPCGLGGCATLAPTNQLRVAMQATRVSVENFEDTFQHSLYAFTWDLPKHDKVVVHIPEGVNDIQMGQLILEALVEGCQEYVTENRHDCTTNANSSFLDVGTLLVADCSGLKVEFQKFQKLSTKIPCLF